MWGSRAEVEWGQRARHSTTCVGRSRPWRRWRTEEEGAGPGGRRTRTSVALATSTSPPTRVHRWSDTDLARVLRTPLPRSSVLLDPWPCWLLFQVQCLYIHTYIHTYIHIHTYTYIHTYIHTCSGSLFPSTLLYYTNGGSDIVFQNPVCVVH